MGFISWFVLGALCPLLAFADCETLHKAWDDEFRHALGVKNDPGFECSGSVSILAEAAQLLKNSLPNTYQWTTHLIDETLIMSAPHQDPTVMATMTSEGRVMRVYPAFFGLDSQEQRASILVHEAAHNVTTRHVTCRVGNEVGSEGGCDEIFSEGWKGGAYNYQFMTMQNLRKAAEKRHELRKAAIDAQIKYLLLNKFNEITSEQIQTWLPPERHSKSEPAPIHGHCHLGERPL